MAFSGHFFDIKNKGHQAVSHDGAPCKRSFFLSHSRDVFQDDAANPINDDIVAELSQHLTEERREVGSSSAIRMRMRML